MKALYSNPPWWLGEESGSWTAGVRAGSRWPFSMPVQSSPDNFVWGGYLPYPFFLGHAASYARAAGLDVAFRDSIALRESYQTFFEHLALSGYDAVVIETSTPSWEHDRVLLQDVRTHFPRLRVVLAGPVGEAAALEAVDAGLAAAAVKGEYEKGALRALNGESGVIGHDLLTAAEMNAAPPPWYDGLHAHRYCDSNPRGQLFPHAQVWSSRGCPFLCAFCSFPATMTGNDPEGKGGRTVRHYAPEYMEAFLTDLVGRYGFRSVYFDDDTFNLGSRHTLAMCRVMRKVGVPWSAMCRFDTVTDDVWREMRASGCFGIKGGVESGSQYVQDRIINKHLDLNDVRRAVGLLKSLGVSVHGTFTLGHPGETRGQQLETLAFIEELKALGMDTYQCSGVAEIEGTPLHTLRLRGQLDHYPGAKIDAGYRRETDGNVKMQALVKELREG